MKKTFCTVSTADYLPFVLTLNDSLLKHDNTIQLSVFISDERKESFERRKLPLNIEFYFTEDLCNEGIGEKIYLKYSKISLACFLWSMKSVFILYLIQKKEYDKVIFVDNDIHFFYNYNFLFKKLDVNSILLSPHWRSSNPLLDEGNFIALYNSGLYNGGFIAANRKGIKALTWLANACEFICVGDACKGQFFDQTHLNLLPIYFDNVSILKHRGCNVANWNQIECRREKKGNDILINGEYPVIFIHFTDSTINGIFYENDKVLLPLLEIYKERLKRNGKILIESSILNKPKKEINLNYFKNIKQNLRIRTRIKAFLNG